MRDLQGRLSNLRGDRARQSCEAHLKYNSLQATRGIKYVKVNMQSGEYKVKLRKVNASNHTWKDTFAHYGKKLEELGLHANILKTLVEIGFDIAIQKGWTLESVLRILENV